jgi:peroxiredoxin
MAVKIGDEAPPFELYGKAWGKEAPTFTLASALADGGVVLQFFPLPFTGVCDAQMCAVRDNIGEYQGAGVTVFGITGHYPMLLAAWDKEHAFGAEVLADYTHEVSEAYVGLYTDVLPSNLKLTTKRGVVGISRDGIVRSVWVSEQPGIGPDEQVVRSAIEAARFEG